MPLLPGKKNIGHNIEVEQEHNKPHDQAVAIALRVAGVPKKDSSEQPKVSYAQQMHANYKRSCGM